MGMPRTRFWTLEETHELRAAMARSGLSIADLEVRTGCSRWALYKYADGTRRPSQAVADRIWLALGSPVGRSEAA